MTQWINDPWSHEQNIVTTGVTEAKHETHSKLLGPDGKPLSYEPRQRFGFDLTPKQLKAGEQ